MNIQKQISKLRNYIKNKSRIIIILLNLSIIGLGIFSPYNSYAMETMHQNTEIIEMQGLETTVLQANDDDPINKKERNINTLLFILTGSLIVLVSTYLTLGVGILAFGFAWNEYFIAAIITLLLGLPTVILGSIFSFKALIKRFLKKEDDKSKKQDPSLKNNKRKNKWGIFAIGSAILAITIPVIYYWLFS